MKDGYTLLMKGGEALESGSWEEARILFSDALALEESADAHAGLGQALWWLGDLRGAMEHRETAYSGFRRESRNDDAFVVGLLILLDYQGHFGNDVAANGWLSRLQRLAEDHGLQDVDGWLLLASATLAGDPTAGERLAREALDFARVTTDVDLELCALAETGAQVVSQGRYREGISLLDEAMAGSLGGEAESRDIVVFTSCNMMVSCIEVSDYDRATRWVQAADRFSTKYGCPFLYAECRTIYGAVLFATGDWASSEHELRTAIASSRDSVPVFHGQALATYAGLRLAQGELGEARRIVNGIEDHPWAVPVIARIHLRAGRPEAAESVLSRRLAAVGSGLLEAGYLEELYGEAGLALSRTADALERGAALVEMSATVDAPVFAARGHRLLGRVRHAVGESESARVHLTRALELFLELQMPYEVALTRIVLGESLAMRSTEAGASQLQQALNAFDRLGARWDADRTAQMLRDLGVDVRHRGGKRREGLLTNREREVLTLLGEGLSNPEIAERLFISRKTVEHHVARILSKLGVRNRTEAAAEALKRP